MNFVHPLMLLAGVAVAAPVLVHWLTRPRPVRLYLSTVRFVMQAVNQRRARHRLRDVVILLLRAAAVALLIWAFARPLFGQKALVSAADSSGGVRVVILDQSASMGAVVGGASAFEKGRAVTAEFLQAGGGGRANLILANAAPRGVFESPSANVGALRDELGRAVALPQRANVQAAIKLAGDMLAKSPSDQRRELVIVSDFQRSNWAGADFSELPKDTKIELKSVAPADRMNVGILRVAATGRAEQGRELRVEVDVGNFSPAARDAQVELAVGAGTYRLAGLCPPWTTTTLSATLTPADAGWQVGRARLTNVEDSMAVDAERSFAIDVRPSPTYLLVTRESAKPAATSSHFVERALAPTAGAAAKPSRGAAKVVRLDPAKLDKDAVAAADLIVIDHPGKLAQASANLLAGMMRRGRAVLYVAAESQDATNLKMIAEAAGAEMKMPVEFVPTPAGQGRRGLFLAELRKDEPPFAAFGESLPAATGGLRFGGGLNSRNLDGTGALISDVLASYGDRSAALVATTCGAGALGVLNADLSVSNLGSSPAFVPLLTELIGRLTGGRADQSGASCGEALALYLPPDAGAAAGLTLDPPDETGQLSEENALVVWRWNAAGRPGVYQVKRGPQTVFAVAAGVPKEESDLRTIDAAVMGRLSGGREIHFDATAGAGEEPKDRAWAWALAACAACMTAELGALKWFRT